MEGLVMTDSPKDDPQPARKQTFSVQTYARVAGVLLLLSLFAGGFGEAYVPSRLIVFSDATATAQNFRAFELLFRMGFAGYLVEAVCDVALSLILYVLLKPVRKEIALLAAFFGLVGTAVFATSELFYLAPTLILGGGDYLKTFTFGQLDTLALMSFRLFTYGSAMFTVFYGMAWVFRGYLIFRSRYLPEFLGILMMLGGAAFIVRNFLLTLAPSHAPGILLLLMLPGGLCLPIWLLVKGVNLRIWEATSANSDLNI
jgi:hypothetical protein